MSCGICECFRRAGATFSEKVGNPVKRGAKLTSEYVQEKWREILGVVIAWCFIAVGLGVMYGFNPLARNLSIGLACGIGLGILVGIIVVNCAKPLQKESTIDELDYYSLWGLANRGINSLNENGTRMVVLSVLVTIILTFTPILPIPAGGVIGFLGSNYFVTQIGYWTFIKEQTNLPKKPSLAQDVESLKIEVAALRSQGNEQKTS